MLSTQTLLLITLETASVAMTAGWGEEVADEMCVMCGTRNIPGSGRPRQPADTRLIGSERKTEKVIFENISRLFFLKLYSSPSTQ